MNTKSKGVLVRRDIEAGELEQIVEYFHYVILVGIRIPQIAAWVSVQQTFLDGSEIIAYHDRQR